MSEQRAREMEIQRNRERKTDNQGQKGREENTERQMEGEEKQSLREGKNRGSFEGYCAANQSYCFYC